VTVFPGFQRILQHFKDLRIPRGDYKYFRLLRCGAVHSGRSVVTSHATIVFYPSVAALARWHFILLPGELTDWRRHRLTWIGQKS